MNQSQIEDVLNSIVYALYAQSGQQDASENRIGNLEVFSHPDAVDQIVKAPVLFRKNFSMISALGQSRFNTNDENWAIRREITQDAYLAAARPAQQNPVSEVYTASLSQSDASLAGIQKALFSASLTIFYRAFGLVADIGPTLTLIDRVRDVLRRLQYFSWVAPTISERERAVHDARQVVTDFAGQLAAEPGGAAVMARFSEKAREIEGFSPVEEFVMNVFAGVETTVATVLWVIDRLGANEKVQQRVQNEIDTGKTDTPYTDCIVNETMRYLPPIPFLVREVGAETALDGRQLRTGQLILISVVGVHQHPAFWTDPKTFDASRREFIEDTYDRRAFIPFLTGPRMCGGARLGRLEVKEAVRAVVGQFSFSRADNVIRFDYGLALRPAAGSSVGVERR
jgi:cytochrome P450